MQFSSNLFISEGLEEKKDKIMKKMVKKKKNFSCLLHYFASQSP